MPIEGYFLTKQVRSNCQVNVSLLHKPKISRTIKSVEFFDEFNRNSFQVF